MKIQKDIRWKPTGRAIGEGGQAQVQEVQDSSGEHMGKYVLKALAKGKPRQAYNRFYGEISAIKGLNHPYIVTVVDSSTSEDDFHYYVMELIEGAKPLMNFLGATENPFFCNQVVAIDLFQKLAEVILACEQNKPKIIHRDLTPGNVLLVPDGTIRIIDFGICQIEGEETITLMDEEVDTINYMAHF